LDRRSLLKAAAFGSAAGTLGAARGAPAQAADGFPTPSYIRTNGLRMAVYEQGAGLPVVFSHGFPELAYSWRYQLPALDQAGLWAIAPDQRGYGNTQIPLAVEAYTIVELCRDLAGLLDVKGIDKAVFCGHDWGGAVVWNMALLHPERVLGVIGVNTAFRPRPPQPPIALLRQLRGESNYVVAFQAPGVAEAVLEQDIDKTFRMFMRKGFFDAETFNRLPPDAPERKFQLLDMIAQGDPSAMPGVLLMSEEELRFYVDTYTRTGFTGGINWYRNIDRNWELTAGVEPKIDQPCLYVGAEDDVVLPPSSADGMEQWVPNLEKHTIADCGHWTQQEKPEELNRILVTWLKKTFV
jgi:pimeloyl-ACP methyl ester carboxylesterase